MKVSNVQSRAWPGFIVIALLGLLLSFGALADTKTMAGDQPCDQAVITQAEAEKIATGYLEELGYDEHSPSSVWHFSMRDSECINGQWRVRVDLGAEANIKNRRVVLVNCQTGEVEDHFAEAEDLAAK